MATTKILQSISYFPVMGILYRNADDDSANCGDDRHSVKRNNSMTTIHIFFQI